MTAWALSPRALPRRAKELWLPACATRIRTPPVCVSSAGLLLYTARLAHHLPVAARQFYDPTALAASDRIMVYQVPPDAQRHRTRPNEIHCVGLIDKIGSNQWDVREWRLESPDVSGAAVGRAWKDLNEIGASLPGGHNLGGRQGTREDN